MTKKIIVLIFLLPVVFSNSTALQAHPAFTYNNRIDLQKVKPALQFKIIPAPNNTWGYDILKDRKVFIHQPNRPGMAGTSGFATKNDATKVALLVIAKIKKGEMPPTVTLQELRALHIQF